jgi:hypothetical protein
LDDQHSFRQCQTAISTYYTIKDGFHLDYETPVLGKPWSIPLEFPLYQWVVAATTMLFHSPLDQTGRFWSLLFFYLSLFPLFSLLGVFTKDREKRLLVLSFVLINPTYLFWSRTFLIESLVLFLGLVYLWSAAKALDSSQTNSRYFLLAAFVGSLTGLTKVTTWVAFCLPCFLLILRAWFEKKNSADRQKARRSFALNAVLLLGIPFLVALSWSRFADYHKSLNPLANNFLTSASQTQIHWIFGSLAQRLSLNSWSQIIEFSSLPVTFENPSLTKNAFQIILILIWAFIFFFSGRRKALLLCFSFFIFPILVFFNLYYVHTYYFYTNGIFLSILMGLSALSLLEENANGLKKFFVFSMLPVLLAASYAKYISSYDIFHEQHKTTGYISQMIRENTDPDGVLLIYGEDWDPTIPYYSQRRALMDRWEMSLEDPRMKKAVELLGKEQIQAILVFKRLDPGFLDDKVRFFDLDPQNVHLLPGALLFTRKTQNNPSHSKMPSSVQSPESFQVHDRIGPTPRE